MNHIVQIDAKKRSKENESDNFCYNKAGRVITLWEAIKKSPIREKFTI